MGRRGNFHHSGADVLGHWRVLGPSSRTGQSPASGEEEHHRRDSLGNCLDKSQDSKQINCPLRLSAGTAGANACMKGKHWKGQCFDSFDLLSKQRRYAWDCLRNTAIMGESAVTQSGSWGSFLYSFFFFFLLLSSVIPHSLWWILPDSHWPGRRRSKTVCVRVCERDFTYCHVFSSTFVFINSVRQQYFEDIIKTSFFSLHVFVLQISEL